MIDLPRSQSMATIIVSGALANKPCNGGEAWVRLNWILGFRRLGCQVFFVEQVRRDHCLDAAGAVVSFEESINRAYFDSVVEKFGLADASILVYEGGEQTSGLAWRELVERMEAADLLVNISGHLRLECLLRLCRRKVFVDLDPGFTQYWHASGVGDLGLAGHDYYVTVGANIGNEGCSIPTGGIQWEPIRPPILLQEWRASTSTEQNRFTTVARWRNPYGPVEYEGRRFGLKHHEFRKMVELPQRASQSFEIALDIDPADHQDLEALRMHGWRIVDPNIAAHDPLTFRRYVQESGGEFSVVQGIYAETCSGWFSDRTAAYLASGKPVLIQDTGFSRSYPVGDGLLAFRTLDEAVAGANEIARNYEAHRLAARGLAEEYFDSDRVLSDLMDYLRVNA